MSKLIKATLPLALSLTITANLGTAAEILSPLTEVQEISQVTKESVVERFASKDVEKEWVRKLVDIIPDNHWDLTAPHLVGYLENTKITAQTFPEFYVGFCRFVYDCTQIVEKINELGKTQTLDPNVYPLFFAFYKFIFSNVQTEEQLIGACQIQKAVNCHKKIPEGLEFILACLPFFVTIQETQSNTKQKIADFLFEMYNGYFQYGDWFRDKYHMPTLRKETDAILGAIAVALPLLKKVATDNPYFGNIIWTLKEEKEAIKQSRMVEAALHLYETTATKNCYSGNVINILALLPEEDMLNAAPNIGHLVSQYDFITVIYDREILETIMATKKEHRAELFEKIRPKLSPEIRIEDRRYHIMLVMDDVIKGNKWENLK